MYHQVKKLYDAKKAKQKRNNYKWLMNEATEAKNRAERKLKEWDNEINKLCAEVNLSPAQMEEEVKKAHALKKFEEVHAKKVEYTQAVKDLTEAVKNIASKDPAAFEIAATQVEHWKVNFTTKFMGI